MGQVSVPVNGRSFTVTCEDGQEPRLRRLAQFIDAKIAGFVAGIGQVGDAKLLLLAALAIADELAEAKEALQEERNHPSSAAPDNLANAVQGVSKPVEAIAAGLPTP